MVVFFSYSDFVMLLCYIIEKCDLGNIVSSIVTNILLFEMNFGGIRMKKSIVIVLLLSVAMLSFADWLVEVKVEGMEYTHDNKLEGALLLETITNDIATYDSTENYLWKTAENPAGSYKIERWDQLGDLVNSLLNREDYNFVGIYTKNWRKGMTLVPYIFVEQRFTDPGQSALPENIPQYSFGIEAPKTIISKSFRDGQGYFTTNINSIIDDQNLKTYAREYQREAGVRGYFVYPLKNGEITIGLLVIATKNPGITEEQFFRIKQYSDAATWLVLQLSLIHI